MQPTTTQEDTMDAAQQQEMQQALDTQNAMADAIRACAGYELSAGISGYAVSRTDAMGTQYLVDARDTPAAAWIDAAKVLHQLANISGQYEAVRACFSEGWGDLYVDEDHTQWLWDTTWPSVEVAYGGDVTTEHMVQETARRVAAAIACMAYGVGALEGKAGTLPASPVGA